MDSYAWITILQAGRDGPQEYTLIKLKIVELMPKVLAGEPQKHMPYQGFTAENGKVHYLHRLEKASSSDLIGCSLEALLTKYKRIFALPMLIVKDDNGTGVVTSVHLDAPDDVVALSDLKEKKPLPDRGQKLGKFYMK
uniref:Uncharacterized protein n=1 Tax=Ditylenchus dipsaci TaxID=166011 RepID=A0A915CPL3_9BILA